MKPFRLLIAGLALLAFVVAWQLPDKISPQHLIESKTSSDSLKRWVAEQKLMALLYVQTSAEYEALCMQTYSMAKISLAEIVRSEQDNSSKPAAVVFDVDETVLDNSPYEAAAILDGFSYPTCWDDWCNKAEAKPVPGAVDFIRHIQALGLQPLYITNRRERLREATKLNLKSIGLGEVDDSHLIMRTDENSKEGRRQQVAEDFRVLMLVGDNLADFAAEFESGNPEDRRSEVHKASSHFGNRYIILPNPLYGNWENAMYEPGLEAEKIRAARLSFLRPMKCGLK